jgi:hypothetical protein
VKKRDKLLTNNKLKNNKKLKNKKLKYKKLKNKMSNLNKMIYLIEREILGVIY